MRFFKEATHPIHVTRTIDTHNLPYFEFVEVTLTHKRQLLYLLHAINTKKHLIIYRKACSKNAESKQLPKNHTTHNRILFTNKTNRASRIQTRKDAVIKPRL